MTELPFEIDLKQIIAEEKMPVDLSTYVISKIVDDLIVINKNPDLTINKEEIIKSFTQIEFIDFSTSNFVVFKFKFDFIAEQTTMLLFKFDENLNYKNFSIISVDFKNFENLNYFENFPKIDNTAYNIDYDSNFNSTSFRISYQFNFKKSKIAFSYTQYFNSDSEKCFKRSFVNFNAESGSFYNGDPKIISVDEIYKQEKLINFFNFLTNKNNISFLPFEEISSSLKLEELLNGPVEKGNFDLLNESILGLISILDTPSFEDTYKMYKLMEY